MSTSKRPAAKPEDHRDAREVVDAWPYMTVEGEWHPDWLQDSVAEGYAQIERGESVELTPEHMERIFQRSIENARMEKPIK